MIKRNMDGSQSLTSIIDTYGVEDSVAVIELPENASIKEQWLVSDTDCVKGTLHIPKSMVNLPPLISHELNSFVLCPKQCQLNIILVDSQGYHLPNHAYELVLAEKSIEGVSDEKGHLSETFETLSTQCLLVITLEDGSQRSRVCSLDDVPATRQSSELLSQQGFYYSEEGEGAAAEAFLYDSALMFANNMTQVNPYVDDGVMPRDDFAIV